ncbi:MFS transporter [Elizabethkingia meningoseptica]|uniref:MFS transporter n=1 Tax=Elizabethkingia meningoseptica TaxID=238 RepID=UPI000332D69A|nr:MFS transporter [Elizabethkingia meningoseptica]AQX06226.1 MFS transporter [Elizabethkingia meningoseptica]AQX48273.1 MFS transporter [Elizabethkingia meningoseptica]EOR29366.1 major facilitator superfamily protein [Elizabethkingia meningoseptica ATCC 13253 = NBRC 12535]KUY16358.1 MFS transporter [Elizabethkingia meningoseptica]MDE5487767.1 MFS transporter [Elizabethkingia meningoseptica]
MNNVDKADRNTKRFRNIKLCIFLSGLSVFAQIYLFQPLLPMVSEHFQRSVGDSSLLVSSSTIGMALGLFFFAFKADDFSRKKLMVFSLLTSAILTIISVWIPSLPLLIAIGVIKGFVISGVSSVALAYLTEEVSVAIVGMAISMYISGNTIGGMSGRILATIIAGEIGWQKAVLIIGIESLLLGLIFWKFFPESRFFVPQKINFSRKLKQMGKFISDPYMLRLYLIAALLMGVFVSVYNYLTFRLESPPFSLNHLFVAFIFLMYTFGVFGTMATSRLSQRFEQKYILRIFIITMLGGVCLLLSHNVTVLIIGLALLTFSFFAVHTMASRLITLHAKEGKSSATSIYWLFYYFGSSILGSGTGYLLHATSWTGFVTVLLLTVAISFLLTIGNRNPQNIS